MLKSLTPRKEAYIRKQWKAGEQSCLHSRSDASERKKQKDGSGILICVTCTAQM